MRHLMLSVAVLAACRPTPTEEGPAVDTEGLLTMSQSWADVDIAAYETETTVDSANCVQPVWLFIPVFAHNPDTGDGEGIHLEDRTFPVSEYNEGRPRIVNFTMEEDGTYTQVGLEWYYEPPGQVEENPPPDVYGVEMDGIMNPHTPYQFLHYDIHAWLWNYTSEENQHGYFNQFNRGMGVPSWWLDYEPTLFDSFKFLAPPTAFAEMGYTGDGTCMADLGFKLTNDTLSTTTPDPFNPNSIYHDQNGMWLGSEWSIENTGQAAPTMWGQTFQDDGNGNYVLRIWPGAVMNPEGFFNMTHSLVDCAAPPAPVECMGPP